MPDPGRQPAPKAPLGLRLIAAAKLAKGIVLSFLSLGILDLIHKDVAAVALHFVLAFRISPENRFVVLLLEKLGLVEPATLVRLGILTALYASVLLVEGLGLWFGAGWAEYMVVDLVRAVRARGMHCDLPGVHVAEALRSSWPTPSFSSTWRASCGAVPAEEVRKGRACLARPTRGPGPARASPADGSPSRWRRWLPPRSCTRPPGPRTPAPRRPRITGLSHVALWVANLDRSRAFYKGYLGFDEAVHSAVGGRKRAAHVDKD